jgi:hypothetical protein
VSPSSRRIPFLLACTCLLTVGCYVQSLNPLYTDTVTHFDPELVGTWVAERDEEFLFTLVDSTRGTYTLLCEESGSTSRFEAVLVDFDDVIFLDIYPEEPHNENSFYMDHLLRVHNILRVERSVDTLWVADFDAEWLGSMIERRQAAIAHVPLDGAVLLTAPTLDLQAFVRKYAKSPEAFSEPVRLRRTM